MKTYKVWYAQFGNKTTKEITFKSFAKAKGLFDKLKNSRKFVYLVEVDKNGTHHTLASC